MQDVARQAVREYIENHSRSALLDQVLDKELPHIRDQPAPAGHHKGQTVIADKNCFGGEFEATLATTGISLLRLATHPCPYRLALTALPSPQPSGTTTRSAHRSGFIREVDVTGYRGRTCAHGDAH